MKSSKVALCPCETLVGRLLVIPSYFLVTLRDSEALIVQNFQIALRLGVPLLGCLFVPSRCLPVALRYAPAALKINA
jgi:hypothetical protein